MHKGYADFHAPRPHYSKVYTGRSKKAKSMVIAKTSFFTLGKETYKKELLFKTITRYSIHVEASVNQIM